MNIFKRIAAMMLAPLMALSMLTSSVSANEEEQVIPIAERTDVAGIEGKCKSALLMEAGTGRVLYEYNADQAMPPASVTKIMTLLLVMEAIEDGKISFDDKVTASAHAASMGGSQIYLKEGEIMSVEDMVKSVVISSANDAACALAEFVSGSEGAFVEQMNNRAAELGMKSTAFENTNGLDDTAQNHLTSARDIAIMSRELIKHKKILEYSSIWMDTVRNGLFGLTNTNRLVRFYRGCTGLKTGSTAKAGFCISATAERDGMSLICVIMGSPTRDERNSAAAALLDWGFANYAVYNHTPKTLDPLRVKGGSQSSVPIKYDGFSTVTGKGDASGISCRIELPESISAPVKKGDKVGEIVFEKDGNTVGKSDVYADGDVDRISFFELWYRILVKFLLK
jgi:D-alanyl-D-alanine carboxypeptidase (penicillin-binding protein 5/6)